LVAPERFDVAVVGGGTAGVAAACCAADLGARTLLVEAATTLGGNATQALVHTFCGLHLPADAGAPRYANPGFPRRFAEGLARAGGAGALERAGRVYVLPVFPPVLEGFAAGRCARRPGLATWTDARVVAARIAADAAALEVERGGARVAVEAALVVDASGDGTAAALAGAEVALAAPDQLQCASYIVRLEGVEPEATQGFKRLQLTAAVAGAAHRGELPGGCESVLVRPGAAPGEAYLTLNVPRPEAGMDPLDPARVRELEAAARESVTRLLAHLRATQPAFARARLLAWPRRLGLREGRRVVGVESVSREDVLAGRRREDEVCLSSWPIELWSDHRRARFEHPAAACSVPLGALVSRSHARLAAAGRCLSADHEALGALRVIGTALATGEAAGVAAALAADAGSDLRSLSPERVRRAILGLEERSPA
jgi:hypothetical protein